ncbi:GNAT family N-acetyltransferase [Profundibacter amoris]|uniref:GNAT family N-acetyltransferase n=1 Tax=Profundibacter amoris TaxID=2171755 RepID=A0A347UKQ0_9RHOB|nr:GNAT family N-acetyltransferase [Profundibacter amoris]AXX99428.1 GNAT family N-acetyltransferase [Profundibacter amoris]
MTPQILYQTTDATWPAAEYLTVGNWTIRRGDGGGQRVSSATANGPVTSEDISVAEQAQDALGQPHLFMIRQGDEALDALLEAKGYRIKDPVNQYACPVETLTKIAPERLAAFAVWPPLAIINEIWTEQGIGAGRQAVMARARGPKTAILARQNDRAAGVAYVAIHGTTAMLHALEVVPEQRRQGVAVNIMGVAAKWAQDNGATGFSVICLRDNLPANRLYASLGMENVGYYHYRIKDQK